LKVCAPVAVTTLYCIAIEVLVAAVDTALAMPSIVDQEPLSVSASPVAMTLFSVPTTPITRSPATSAVPAVVADGTPVVEAADTTVLRSTCWPIWSKPHRATALAAGEALKVTVMAVAEATWDAA
jgi:hypothetical protein